MVLAIYYLSAKLHTTFTPLVLKAKRNGERANNIDSFDETPTLVIDSNCVLAA
jgi:hypothetical protein